MVQPVLAYVSHDKTESYLTPQLASLQILFIVKMTVCRPLLFFYILDYSQQGINNNPRQAINFCVTLELTKQKADTPILFIHRVYNSLYHYRTGAHSLGACRPENSGFAGRWDNTPLILDNDYYISLTTTPQWVAVPVSKYVYVHVI